MKRYIPQVVGSLCASSLILAAASQIRADITDGFSSANASNWTFNANATSTTNGVPLISGSVMVLTSDNGNEASSAWYNTPQNISNSWTASFTWQWTSGATPSNPADGFMFVLQNGGLNALGGSGGSKGYQGSANSTSNIAVTPSVGVGVENYGGNTNNLTGGINDQFAQSISVPGSTLNAHTDTNPINFTVSYYAPDNVVNVSAVDSTNSSNAFSYNLYSMPGQYSMDTYPLNPATIVGQNTAYVGFTGATGGASQEQDFSNFNFSAGASVPPNYVPPAPTPAYVSVTRSPIALTASSFNEAEVVPNTASLTQGTAIPTSVLAGSVDGSYAFYEAGTSVTENGTPTPLQGGLPTSGQFVSQGDGVTTFQFQPYTGNTALAISSNAGQMGQNGKALPISGTMTLAAPHAFSTLAILATSGNGASFANVRFNFVDSHGNQIDVATDYAAFDWYNGGSGTTPDGNAWGTALAGIGRIHISNTTPDTVSVSIGAPKLYETAFNLANLTGLNDAGQLVTGNYSGDILNSMTFFGPSGNVTNIYAVSGSADAASSVPEPSVALLLFAGVGLALVLRQRATGARRR